MTKRYLCTRIPLLFLSLYALLLLAAGPALLRAQTTTGSITGSVVDPDTKPVQNAAVDAKDELGVIAGKTTTDALGRFTIADLPAGTYTVEAAVPGFALASHAEVKVTAGGQAADISLAVSLGSISEAITVEADASGSVAAQLAPIDGLLEARSARSEVTPTYIQNFTSPVADFSELVQNAPGTYSVNSNGVGLGDSKTFFRGFSDGNYDIDFDKVPFYDTNDPTHHSWVFFPSEWIGSVDFDRSPGTASTTGPTPFGGSIHLLSRDMAPAPSLRASYSYGSFNTALADAQFDSGPFGFLGNNKSNLSVDVHRMTSDGFQTYNYQMRNAGELKYVYKFSDTQSLTFYSSVLRLDSNTPNAKGPTANQANTLGYNFLLNNNPNSPLYYNYYSYHVPTDVEYFDWKKQFGAWQVDFQPYTLSYYNAQFYDNSEFFIDGYNSVDKLNSYRKYGDNFTVSQVSHLGILRVGAWYEYAATNRYQIPATSVTRVDATSPNFHEIFFTNSIQPFAEYEFHVTRKLTTTVGLKFAHYNQALTQFQDTKTGVGCLGGTLTAAKTVKSTAVIAGVAESVSDTTAAAFCTGGAASISHSGGYSSYLPSVDVSYHLMPNWTVYGQFAMGSKVPPSSVFDLGTKLGANPTVAILPKPTTIKTVQGGTVLKLKNVTFNADAYYNYFQNAYASINDPTNTSAADFVSAGASKSLGMEAEVNVYVARGISVYANGTAGQAKYASLGFVNKGLWVANTPSNTEAFGLTYRQKYIDAGVFSKRVGPQWNDAASAATASVPLNQAIPIQPFNVINFYMNYTVRKGSRFDQTKVRFAINNVLNQEAITGIAPTVAATALRPYTPDPLDQLSLLPGRSFTGTVTFGFDPKGR